MADFRTPDNVQIDNHCPSCGRRLWLKGDAMHSKRRYCPPAWFRNMFKLRLGLFPLGYYRLVKCEVCRKTMAVFDENSGRMRDDVIVLHACTLLTPHLPDDSEGNKCSDQISCYGCPLKVNKELYVDRGY